MSPELASAAMVTILDTNNQWFAYTATGYLRLVFSFPEREEKLEDVSVGHRP